MACNAKLANLEVNWEPHTYNQFLTPRSLSSDGGSTHANVSSESIHFVADGESRLNPPPKRLNGENDDIYGNWSPASNSDPCPSVTQINRDREAINVGRQSNDDVSQSTDLEAIHNQSTNKNGHSLASLAASSRSPLAICREVESMTKAILPHSNSQHWQNPAEEVQAKKRPRTQAPVSPVSAPRTPPHVLQSRKLFTVPSPTRDSKRTDPMEAPPRAKSSIPLSIHSEEYANQCIHAAYSSRLNPFALHPEENAYLLRLNSEFQDTVYLASRNGILRLWVRNPLIMITIEEALGCATDPRYFHLAAFAHEWLIRRGFINFGCVNITRLQPVKRGRGQLSRPATIVVIGAGISGLCCARQLQSLFTQYEHRLAATQRATVPRIVVLEGRSRIGGRVHSRTLQYKRSDQAPTKLRNVAEMGAQIITGFDFGNPLDIVVRGQLALKYHPLKDNLVLYDFDGSPIDEAQDSKIQNLYNEMLERIHTYSWEATQNTQDQMSQVSPAHDVERSVNGEVSAIMSHTKSNVPPLQRSSHPEHLTRLNNTPLTLKDIVTVNNDKVIPTEAIKLVSCSTNPENETDQITLGAKMDETVRNYQKTSEISPKEMRLLNWHYANLEYSNAVNVKHLSLGGWDQDGGNEFDGFHSQVVGGYSQVVQGLSQHPTPLDVRLNKVVRAIHYASQKRERGRNSTRVVTQEGEIFPADYVIATLPLGVLQSEMVAFHPALPKRKTDAMNRLGFGLLNKIILVFESVFWEEDRDMFGVLNQSMVENSLDQKHYESQRGKFYLFWNCIKTSGTPMLVALMAGDAAHETENAEDQILIEDVTTKLSKIFSLDQVPKPVEVIVTRWKKDPFAKGTYSYLGAEARPGDYDRMAEAVGNLHFAGEATCGTHPATVHGALISGLRAACEVGESILGPIPIAESLVAPSS